MNRVTQGTKGNARSDDISDRASDSGAICGAPRSKFALILQQLTGILFVSMETIRSMNNLSPVCLSTCRSFPGWFPFYV